MGEVRGSRSTEPIARHVRLGVDIGGTFTDLVLLNEETGAFEITKVPSRPDDPSGALVAALAKALEAATVPPESVSLLSHGTTIITNAVLEGKLPRTALVTTKGFRDVLEIGRHVRPDMYDLNQDKPVPIVPRDMRFEIEERLAADGSVLVPLDGKSLKVAMEAVAATGPKAVAVSLLHSYANADHERAVRAALHATLPETAVSISSDVCREIREFERTSTATLNAATMPVVSDYLEILADHVDELLPACQVLLMQSNGGSMTVGAARHTPAHLIYSGPAAGVLACQHVGRTTGRRNVLGFDMGGTSTDISLVYRDEPVTTTEADVGGYPVKLPVLDINTIGAGGGSIAWLDSGGALHVGPRSAGADPGPVAYGKGGTEPTVTDANLTLGRIGTERFLGGELALDGEASAAAIREKIAGPLGLDPIVAAAGILRVANANMQRALKVSSAERGYDPRDFTMIAFGGAGPLHAAALAKGVGFPTALVPSVPGVFSALGLIVADVRHDFVRTYVSRSGQANPDTLQEVYREMEAIGEKGLREDGIPVEKREFHRSADMRYVGQAYEVNVPVPGDRLTHSLVSNVLGRFHREHQRLFAHSAPGDPVEFVNLRLAAIGRTDAPDLPRVEVTKRMAPAAGTRRVYFEEAGGFVDCPTYERAALALESRIEGPAIVEQLDCTTVIHPGQRLSVDEWGNLIIDPGD